MTSDIFLAAPELRTPSLALPSGKTQCDESNPSGDLCEMSEAKT